MINRSLFTALFLGTCLATAAAPAWAAGLSDVIRTLETPFQSSTDEQYRIRDYSADFFQESKIASLDRLQRANGRVEVAFDHQQGPADRSVPTVRFRWQYDQPTTQEIVSDGKTMWVYLPENNQVIQSNIEMINQANQSDPMTFLTGLGNLSRDFQIGWAVPNTDADGNFVLELRPRRVSSLINRLLIVVDRYAVEAYQNRGQTERTPGFPTPPQPAQRVQRPQMPSMPAAGGFPPLGFDSSADGVLFPFLSTTVFDPNGNSTIIEFSNLRVNLGIPAMSFSFMLPAGVQVVRPTGKEMGF